MAGSTQGISRDDSVELEHVANMVFLTGASFDAFTSQMRRAFALNAHERLAITALWAQGPMTMTDLGSVIPLSRAAVTTLVDRLEGAGLVRRTSDERDRRRTVVEVSEQTIQRMMPVLAPYVEGLERLVATRSREELETISRFVDEFRALNERNTTRLSSLSDEEIQALARV